MVAVARWHLHFNGDREPAAHICDLHRALGLSRECMDEQTDGNCKHVQVYSCTCHDYLACEACLREEPVMTLWPN